MEVLSQYHIFESYKINIYSVWVQMRGLGVDCGVSANETAVHAHGGQINFEYLTPYLTYDLQYSMSLPDVSFATAPSRADTSYLKVQKPYMEMIHNFSSLSIPKTGGSDN